MPSKVRPKYGHRFQYILGPAGEEDFAREVIDRLAERHDIPPERKAALARFMRGAAGVYRKTENNEEERPRAKHVRAALAEINQTVVALARQLEQADDVTDRLLWAPEVEVSALAADENVASSPYGHSFWRLPHERGFAFWYLDREKIEEALAILGAYSALALRRIPRDKGGRSRDRALFMWVVNAASFWTDQLGRQFTYNPHKNGSTPAYRFCWDALKAVGVPFTRAALGTQMSKVIEQHRNRQRGLSPLRKTRPG